MIMSRFLFLLMAVLLLCAPPSRADIFRWEDDAGTVHFTDDLSNIPARHREKAKVVIREAPPQPSPQGAPESGVKTEPQPPPAVLPPPAESPADAAAREREEVAAQVDTLKAKIAAKEKLIQYVDDKQSPGGNPYRNRIVDPADQDLYRKYQAELPQDKEELRQLESRLERLK